MLSKILPVGLVFMVILLSFQLMGAKRENASLSMELVGSTKAFLSGSELPALHVQSLSKTESIASICAERPPLALFVFSRDCPACAELEPLWRRLAKMNREVRFLQAHIDGLPLNATMSDDPAVLHVNVSPAELVRTLRVDRVPVILVTDEDCLIQTAGTGLFSARYALQAVDSNI